MYSNEILELLRLRNYLISVEEYIKLISSSQVKYVKYNPFEDKFYVSTNDNYNFEFRVNIDKDKIK